MNKLLLLFILLAGLMTASFVGLVVQANNQPTESMVKVLPPLPPVIDEDELWMLVNNWRKSEGRKEYLKSDLLCSFANERKYDLVNDYSHDGFHKRYDNNSFYVSENIVGASSEQEALDKWLNSASHAAALREPYSHSCIKCQNRYCVQLFANL